MLHSVQNGEGHLGKGCEISKKNFWKVKKNCGTRAFIADPSCLPVHCLPVNMHRKIFRRLVGGLEVSKKSESVGSIKDFGLANTSRIEHRLMSLNTSTSNGSDSDGHPMENGTFQPP